MENWQMAILKYLYFQECGWALPILRRRLSRLRNKSQNKRDSALCLFGNVHNGPEKTEVS